MTKDVHVCAAYTETGSARAGKLACQRVLNLFQACLNRQVYIHVTYPRRRDRIEPFRFDALNKR